MDCTITVIGYGNVGRVLTSLLLGSSSKMHLNILDPADHLSGAFLDLKHSIGMQPNKSLFFNDQDVFERSDYVFFTAGMPSQHGASRLSTVHDNVELVKKVFGGKSLCSEMKVITITNPVDVVTAAIVKYAQLPKEQVVGTGTYLDSMRFSYHLAELAMVSPTTVEAIILGEHGESCVPILSHSNFLNEAFSETDLFSNEAIEKALYQTHHAAFEIRKTEPGTSMAVSHCALRIMEYWRQKEETILPISVLLEEDHIHWLDLKHPICMSVLVSISTEGIRLLPPLSLKNGELHALKRSAQILSEYQRFLENPV
jgi:L-lactate dehydrogenase